MNSKINFKYISLITLLLLAAATSWNSYFRTYTQQDTVSIHHFPMVVGEWSAEEIPISKRDLAILETDNALSRRYTTPSGQEVILFIVYSQTNRKAMHPPEICYSGGGITILSNDVYMVTDPAQSVSLDTHRMFVEHGHYQQVANYWFKVGDKFTSNYYKQQILVALKTFLGKPSSSAMIRVSSDVKEENVALTDAAIREFILTILPVVPQYLP